MINKLISFWKFVFPIHQKEMRLFLSLSVMMFFILFNYTVLRDVKDTLIVNAAGAEALSLIKLLGTVPAAFIVMIVYSKLSYHFSRKKLFLLCLLPFLSFFLLFAFVLYPNRLSIHPSTEWIDQMVLLFPRLQTILRVIGCWSYALFYIFSELWGPLILSVLFWQFANDTVKLEQAKRFYPLFGFIGNSGGIVAGMVGKFVSETTKVSSFNLDPWELSIIVLMICVVISGVTIFGLFSNVSSATAKNEAVPYAPKEKRKMSLKDSLLYVMRSKHLLLIALIIVCYGITQNVVEVVWKDQLRQVIQTQNDYNAFMGHFSMVQGIITVSLMVIGTHVVRIFGWFISATITPILMVGTGLLFFAFMNGKEFLEDYTLSLLALTPTVVAVWLGFVQTGVARAVKYAFFDPTKEMCYIPLSEEEKIRGKAAVEVVGSRLGKSGGSIIQQALLIGTGSTLVGISSLLALVIGVVAFIWVVANRSLHTSFEEKILQNEEAVRVLA